MVIFLLAEVLFRRSMQIAFSQIYRTLASLKRLLQLDILHEWEIFFPYTSIPVISAKVRTCS